MLFVYGGGLLGLIRLPLDGANSGHPHWYHVMLMCQLSILLSLMNLSAKYHAWVCPSVLVNQFQ